LKSFICMIKVFGEYIYACLFYFLIYAKGGKEFGEFMHVYFLVYAYMWLFGLRISFYIHLFIAMHKLRGSFHEAYL